MSVQCGLGADYRVVLLYSKERQMQQRSSDAPGPMLSYAGQMLSYYDEIKVLPAPSPSLQAAYTAAAKALDHRDENENQDNYVAAFPQALVAFTEYGPSAPNASGSHKYTEQDIADFWGSSNYGLFFMTMIHLGSQVGLSDAFEAAQKHFAKETCLVYLSFDQSDLLVFGRSNSYKDYAEKVFAFDYTTSGRVTDSITLWSFDVRDKASETLQKLDSTEALWADLRFGTQSYDKALAFSKDICEKNKDADYFCALGRNDMAIVNRKANLKWVYDTYCALRDTEWCTTFDLCIFIPHFEDKNFTGEITPAFCKDNAIARRALLARLAAFETAYKQGCIRVGIQEDKVWLRWLHEVVLQASGFLQNRMSMSIGICLTPQIRDLLSYATKIYQSENLDVSTQEIVTKNFDLFYSNALILIDSMNHSNRQFVQTPAFHVAAFEMPPKIMAYYTAITQYLISALKDDKLQDDSVPFYGYTIAPRFTNALSVSSLAVQQVVPQDEFISIAVDEKILHDLKLTTETLAHEISHYVGWKCRQRENRAQQLICFKICTMIQDLATHIIETVAENETVRIRFDPVAMRQQAQQLCEKETEIYAPKLLANELFDELRLLPKQFQKTPSLEEALFAAVLKIAKESFFAQNQELSFDGRLIKYIENVEGVSVPKPGEGELWDQEPVVRAELERLFDNKLCDLCDGTAMVDSTNFASPQERKTIPEWTFCSIFRETFADLQMILLFNLDWKEYCEIVDIENSKQSDVYLRAIAVGRTLKNCHHANWDKSECETDASAVARTAWQLIQCSNLFEEANDNMDIDPMLCGYLEDYLAVCYDEIERHLEEKKNNESLQKVQKIHNLLRSDSVVNTQAEIISLIQSYKSDMLKSCDEYWQKIRPPTA